MVTEEARLRPQQRQVLDVFPIWGEQGRAKDALYKSKRPIFDFKQADSVANEDGLG